MTFLDVLHIVLAALASLGGGGFIVFKLSDYLGKVWADRALEKQRHEYTSLNLKMTHQLDLVTRRAQVELDALGHLHKLRTESEFVVVSQLWKDIATLKDVMARLPSRGLAFRSKDDGVHQKFVEGLNTDFGSRLSEAYEYLNQEALSIPKDISDAARALCEIAYSERVDTILCPNPFDSKIDLKHEPMFVEKLLNDREKRLTEFSRKSAELETLMRNHRAGKSQDELGTAQK